MQYPFHILRDKYRGRDPKKIAKALEYNRDVRVLDAHIKSLIKSGKRGVVCYSEIATAVNLDKERVAEILYCLDCSTSAFTIPDHIPNPAV